MPEKLSAYYKMLQEREGIDPPLDLVASWDEATASAIINDFQQAFVGNSQKTCRAFPLGIDMSASNQSIGNQVADRLLQKIEPRA